MILRRVFRAAPFLILGAAGACSSVLGIQDATCDPGLAVCNGTAAPDADAPSPVCQEYCDTVLANCPDPYSVYVGPATCLAVCKLLPEGKPGDDMVNTVQCRLRQAQNAAALADPQTHCPAAGPSGTNANGENLCGAACEGYCAIMQAACQGEFSGFPSLDACMTACKDVPDLKGYNLSVTTGDSIQCRLWHVSAAADEPNPHCKHAAGNYPCQ